MRAVATSLLFAAIGALTGVALGGGGVAAVIGMVAGAGVGLVVWKARLKMLVAVAVMVAGAVGSVLGRSVVSVLCAPGGCAGAEWTAAALTAIGAVVGVGLVVALATRSFEEYREAAEHNHTPPGPGLSSDEAAMGSDEPS